MKRRLRLAVVLCCFLPLLVVGMPSPLQAQLTEKRVLKSIERAREFLVRDQKDDGSWTGKQGSFKVGISSLVMLALINAGMTVENPEIKKGLRFLRTTERPNMTYEASLMIMALAAAKDEQKDAALILGLVKRLEDSQITKGESAGSWSYSSSRGGPLDLGGDRSNGQFAVLGLREAQDAGIPVNLETWKRARMHWKLHQNRDGGWTYSPGSASSIGSMTVAGIATMVMTESAVEAGNRDLNPDGTPNCCGESESGKEVEDAARWLGKNFSVRHNPGSGNWLLYYLYGLERAGRLSGRRFFGEGAGKHDWYREGAEYLVDQQRQLDGSWTGVGSQETDPIVGTSFALLFLSKGLAPVLINKAQYGPRAPDGEAIVGNGWNKHSNDVRNLTQLISTLPKWPKLVTWQVVDVELAEVADLLQAPILVLTGDSDPHFAEADVARLKEYVAQGGFIYAESVCRSTEFDSAFRDLIKRMYPVAEARLKQLPQDHPLYRSEYLIDPSSVELWGVDVGCRTSIVYSPHDFSCLWDKWTSFDVPGRSPQLSSMISKAVRVGVNVVAYATGREPANKLNILESVDSSKDQQIERGFLQIAKLRHTGGWDAAPQALRNLLIALNKTVGVITSTKPYNLAALDKALARYPMLYMHGRNNFRFSEQEQGRLKEYFQAGGVLFADACCGAPQFDRGFRQVMQEMFPDHPLKRIPPGHVLFKSDSGYDLKTVQRREPDLDQPDAALKTTVRTVEPFLEGIEFDGRYVVIYSKYDISCALERQASVACSGYIHDDAVRIAMNVVQYFLLQSPYTQTNPSAPRASAKPAASKPPQ